MSRDAMMSRHARRRLSECNKGARTYTEHDGTGNTMVWLSNTSDYHRFALKGPVRKARGCVLLAHVEQSRAGERVDEPALTCRGVPVKPVPADNMFRQ